MYFLSPEKIALARLNFKQLIIIDTETGDRFFEAFGPGNMVNLIDRPYERFHDYEFLLDILKADDLQKYQEIHKGTPFYFLAWIAFGLKDFEKAVFYMDAAISEDQRKVPNRPLEEWINDPAGQFLTINHQGNQVAKDITLQLGMEFQSEFSRFKKIHSLSKISINSFINDFILKIAQDKSKRSIITAMYSFILEFHDRYKMLQLRSCDGGTIEPFLSHLFKGCLITESLLKLLYPKKDDGKATNTLGDLNKNSNFIKDFSKLDTSAFSLRGIVDSIQKSDDKTALNTVSKIRNTSGHNLVWDDIFNDPDNYKKLYEQIMNALFFIINKKYL